MNERNILGEGITEANSLSDFKRQLTYIAIIELLLSSPYFGNKIFKFKYGVRNDIITVKDCERLAEEVWKYDILKSFIYHFW